MVPVIIVGGSLTILLALVTIILARGQRATQRETEQKPSDAPQAVTTSRTKHGRPARRNATESEAAEAAAALCTG